MSQFLLTIFSASMYIMFFFDGVSESLRNCLSFDTEVESIYLFGDFKVITDTEKFTFGERESLIYTAASGCLGRMTVLTVRILSVTDILLRRTYRC